MPDSNGNSEQIRIVAQAVANSTAETTIQKFVEMHPEIGSPSRPEIPAALKFWGLVGGAVAVAMFVGISGWVVTSISSMKDTLARMDERQLLLGPIQEKRFADLETRLSGVEKKQDRENHAALN